MLYVIQVKAGNEHNVLSWFDEFTIKSGEEAFVPVYDRKKKYHGIEEVVPQVLFPGYVFFKTNDVEDLFFRLKNVPKLTKILSAGGEFLPVSSEEEEQLMLLGGDDHHITVSIGVIECGAVHIITGPLANFHGPYKYIDRHKKIARIEMSIGGQTKEVQIGLEITRKS